MFKIGDRTQEGFPCEILSEIPGGNMASLFLARLQNTEHLFVVKAVKKEAEQNYEFLKKEAAVLERLSHPDIPEIYDSIENAEGMYYIMSYHQGISLENYVKSGRLPEEYEIREMVMKICEIFAYLHRSGIVHRDLKPSNILYNAPEGELTLLDFGNAKEIEVNHKQKVVPPKERTAYFHGTLGYAAPECWHSEGLQISPTTDVFSLGALLFYLLEGKNPKEHYGRFILSDTKKKNRWQPVLNMCCALHPEKRCQSAAQVFEIVSKISC